MNIILGNLTSLFANLFDIYSATRKTRKKLIFFQFFSLVFYMTTNLLLKAYSTVVQNVCAIIRNILGYLEIKSKLLEYAIVLSGLLLGLYFNNLGLLGLLPIIANLEYSICLFKVKDVFKLKISLTICNALFVILNICIKNYVGFTFTIVTVITQIIDLIKYKK